MRDGAVLATVSISDILLLPEVTVQAGSQKQVGPTLRSVLSAAGVEAFEKVTVSDMLPERLVGGERTLISAEVDDEMLLAINKRGKVKLASPSIPSERWIIDVTQLAVE